VYEFTELSDAPPIILNLWDKNHMLASDKYLGRALIKITDASTNVIPEGGFGESLPADVVNKIPKPKWHPIRLGNNDLMPVTG
jgi:hypothetical protein